MNELSQHLRLYFTFLYIVMFGMLMLFWPYAHADTPQLKLYLLISSAAYSLLFLLPAIFITFISRLLKTVLLRNEGYKLIFVTAWLSSSLSILLIYADYQIYTLYEYHFNGFVWNLLTTSGGIDALGITLATQLTVVAEVIAFLILTLFLLWLSGQLALRIKFITKRAFVSFISIMLLVSIGEETVYAYSIYTGKDDLIRVSSVIPYHLKSSAHSFFKRLNIKQTSLTNLRLAHGIIDYPLSEISSKTKQSYPNIIMLVAESFRWDLLDPVTTPNLWELSKRSLNFQQHYSGGNRTRMGMLSMFYGLYAPYWYGLQEQKIAPVMMEQLRSKGYQFALHTSQSFDYPELRDTVFQGMDERDMEELKTGEPWKRDQQNISDIIDKLNERDKQKPFFGFMFFEATHAPYSFSDKDIVKTNYLAEMNYADLNLRNDIDKIHNRYINAAHSVDAQAGRLIDYLNKSGLSDNTIILFTGDHGEEFMENGHWGHGHNEMFPEQQIHVPLILSIPNVEPQLIGHKTSHIQIPQTLMERIGVITPYQGYSLADDLFTKLPFLVAGNYNYLCIIDDKHKLTFPFTSSDYFHYTVFETDDSSIKSEDKSAIIAQMRGDINTVINESNRFIKSD